MGYTFVISVVGMKVEFIIGRIRKYMYKNNSPDKSKSCCLTTVSSMMIMIIITVLKCKFVLTPFPDFLLALRDYSSTILFLGKIK